MDNDCSQQHQQQPGFESTGCREAGAVEPQINFQPPNVLHFQPPGESIKPPSPSFWPQVVFHNKKYIKRCIFNLKMENIYVRRGRIPVSTSYTSSPYPTTVVDSPSSFGLTRTLATTIYDVK